MSPLSRAITEAASGVLCVVLASQDKRDMELLE